MSEIETPEPAPRLTPQAKRGLMAGGVVIAVIAVATGFALAGRGEAKVEKAAPKPTTTTSTTKALPVTTTTEPDKGPVAPLTGLRLNDPAALTRPALAVKVDNLDAPRESALPQMGLPKADVVFEEIVEGDITRLVAVFHSQNPGRVGPVRSARTTDVHLLPQLGRPLLAWSGGNGGVVGAVRSSPSIVDVGHDAATPAYARDGGRRAPHNLFVQTDQLWDRAPADAGAPPKLFSYRAKGQSNPPTAGDSRGVDITWGGGAASSPVSWRWDPKLKVYLRSQNGRPHRDADGTQLSAQNVVVLATQYGASPADTRSPEALTVGHGEAYIYTYGKVIHGRWNRPAENKPAVLVGPDNKPAQLTPGQTWVELPRSGAIYNIP